MSKPSGADRLAVSVRQLTAYFERNRTLSECSGLGITSAFWRQVLGSRPNFPDINALLAFRRANYGYGIGEERQSDQDSERSYFERIAYLMRHSVPDEFVQSIAEPLFGAPYVFGYGTCTRSASFLVNAATAYHVCQEVAAAGLRGKVLDVCEIGPGWGSCAYQLHRALRIRSYTLVDLPENLLLSSAYLSTTLRERSLETVEVAGGAVAQASENMLRAVLPGALERLRCRFDVVLNSFSLQEMEKPTVDLYISWVLDHLSPAGIFISINSHGKAGAKLPRDYGFERFEVRRLAPFRKYPTGFFNTIPYAATLACRRRESAHYSEEVLDVLCGLMQLGLAAEVQPLADAFVADKLTTGNVAWLAACARCFAGRSNAERMSALEKMGPSGPSVVRDYLQAHLWLVEGDVPQAISALRRAAPELSGFPLLRAAAIAHAAGAHWPSAPPLDVRRAYPEIQAFLLQHDLSPFVRHFESVAAAFRAKLS